MVSALLPSAVTVAEIFRTYGPAYRREYGDQMPYRHYRAMNAIEACRTAQLGGHVDKCDKCGHLRISYNSCRNRHCPLCQNLEKERWLDARSKELLPVPYFHLTITLPEALRPLSLRNQRVTYNLQFKSVAETLHELARDPKYLGAQIGFTAVLHTWSQTLMFHPHLHCIVPGGGLSFDGERRVAGREDFFIPYKVLSRKFRGKYLHYLKATYNDGQQLAFPGEIEHLAEKKAFNQLLSGLYAHDWVANCRLVRVDPQVVMEYVGRYVYRVAISNERLLNLADDMVTFAYRDSADDKKTKRMDLEAFEFIRRYLYHILPDRFVKIRHYGILCNRNKATKLVRCQQLLGVTTTVEQQKVAKETWFELLERVTGTNPLICPKCGKGRMGLKEILPPKVSRSPPNT